MTYQRWKPAGSRRPLSHRVDVGGDGPPPLPNATPSTRETTDAEYSDPGELVGLEVYDMRKPHGTWRVDGWEERRGCKWLRVSRRPEDMGLKDRSERISRWREIRQFRVVISP